MVAADPLDEVRVLLFDVFGTLVDWRSTVIAELQTTGDRLGLTTDWEDLADRWRGRYQPSMAEVREGRRPYLSLDVLHRESLVAILAEVGLDPLPDDEIDRLNRVWHRLQPWPDTPPGFARLAERAELAAMSNADVVMVRAIADHAGIAWHHVFGAEPARMFKPRPEVFLHALSALGLDPDRVMMVAAHNRDLEVTADLGLRTAFVVRPTEYGPTQTTDLTPTGPWDVVCDDLVQLADRLGAAPAHSG
ncbi:MAG: haloacid dehalogenase type II [Actinomycetota bacterium]